jgi:hypothetical protein
MRFLKVIVPPLVAFWAFALLIKFTPFFHHVDGLSQIGEDSVYGVISYYKVFAPVQIVIALLTQWLFIMPIWDRVVVRPKQEATVFIGITLLCLAVACGISYIIWDPLTGRKHWIDNCLFMTGVQLFYWLVNFLALLLLDFKAFRKANTVEEADKK